MPMRMVCPANAASVRGWFARFPRLTRMRPIEVSPQALEEQPFAPSEMGESMDTDLLPKLSGETWVASTLLD